MWWTYSAGSPTTPFEDLFGGGAMAGPIYSFDASNPSPSKFPAYFDNRYFFFDWTTDWVATAAFNTDGTVKDHRFFLPLHTFVKPMDMKFGADGALYVLAYGNGWGANNDDTGLYRVSYTEGNRKPTIKATTNKDSGPAPLDGELRRERLHRPGQRRPDLQPGTSRPTARSDATARDRHPHLHDARRGRGPADGDRRAGRQRGAELPARGRQHAAEREDQGAVRRRAARARAGDPVRGRR